MSFTKTISARSIIDQLAPVLREITESAAQREADRDFSRDLVAKLKASGFTRLRVPTEFGGFGLSLPEAFEVLVELAAADSNLAQGLRPHFLAVESLLTAPDSEHRSTWLRRIGEEGVVVGNALTEVGNKSGNLSTTIREVDGKLVVSGTKFYSTGSLYADWIQVHALDENDQDVFVFIDRDAKGVTLFDDWDGFGQQLSASGTSIFDNVVVDPIDVAYREYSAPGAFQATAQSHHLSTLTGISRAVVRDIVDYVQARTRVYSHGSGDLPRHDPQVQQVIGEVKAASYGVDKVFEGFVRALDRVSTKAQAGTATEEDYAAIDLEAYQAQLTIAPVVLAQATKAFEVGGASAASKKLGLDRHWRNARVLANHNPIIYRARLIGADAVNGGHVAAQYTIGSHS
ncbi:acyl-CoA dehydrogenase family protein [Corynebacterium lubricantis]|uniref:acyl-CoA dehydrogenase family protein n=1 Tax=Corynebacterium lubricantis TaxID=541095 RepID=UPI00036E91C7|nr:acyl-CoA dehydrogenase family protein [Corynebacterium lubricantis]